MWMVARFANGGGDRSAYLGLVVLQPSDENVNIKIVRIWLETTRIYVSFESDFMANGISGAGAPQWY